MGSGSWPLRAVSLPRHRAFRCRAELITILTGVILIAVRLGIRLDELMKILLLFTLLLAAPLVSGQTTSITTGKPNVFGETKTVIRDSSGRVSGTASTSKPNVFGEQKTVIRDATGRVTGTATTNKPNVFGEQKTVIRDVSGRVTGSATAAKPNIFGETRTTFRDQSGRTSGTGTTTKPNLFGETKTVIRGQPSVQPKKK